MKDLQLYRWYGQDLEARKGCYGEVAELYQQVRPNYPQVIISRIAQLTDLNTDSILLEIGPGPGKITVPFAQLGLSIVAIEPNPQFYQLAQHNCQTYPKITLINTSLEEWELERNKYHAVLAANSFHWIPPEVGYPKAADALKKDGYLILIWNMVPQPPYEIYQLFREAYQIYAPSLDEYEDKSKQIEIVRAFGENIMNSGKFQPPISEHLSCKRTYSAREYIMLLNTFSPHRALPEEQRNGLFDTLASILLREGIDSITTSYLCAFNIAKKI